MIGRVLFLFLNIRNQIWLLIKLFVHLISIQLENAQVPD